jgi:hypothetical protein
VNSDLVPGLRRATSSESSRPFMPPGMITSVNRRSNRSPAATSASGATAFAAASGT